MNARNTARDTSFDRRRRNIVIATAIVLAIAVYFGTGARAFPGEPPARGAAKYVIPQENLQIPEKMQACAANLRRIHAAIKEYQKKKGTLPNWLSDLVPDYLGKEVLLCPNDAERRAQFSPDPKLPCSYSWEFSATPIPASWDPTGKTLYRDWKAQQVKLFGDVVPTVRCNHHGEQCLNLGAGGQVYWSALNWEYMFKRDYHFGDERASQKRGTELDQLLDRLKQKGSGARARAASALGKLGDKRAVEPLIAALKDDDAGVRRSAAEALAKLDWQPATDLQRACYLVALQKWAEAVKLGPSAVEPFLVALKVPASDEDMNVRASAQMAFAKIGPAAVEPAIAALKDKDARLHYSAVVALSILRDKRAVEPLIAALKHDDRIVRSESASALGVLGDKRAVEPLIAVLKDTDARVRRSAAEALGELGDKRAVEPLLAAMKDQDKYVRGSAGSSLGQLGDKRAVEPLIAAMSDEDRDVRLLAGSALVRLADKGSADRLAALLKDPDISVRASAVATLARMGDKRAFEPLIVALKDQDSKVRFGAASSLGQLGDKRAVEPLIAALKDKDASVRGSVAAALGQLGDKRAVEPLVAATKDQDKSVRSSAGFALGLLGDERAVEPILAAIPDSGMMGLALMGMLARIGPPAVEPLIAALKHEDKRMRYTAAHVLVSLDDQRAVEPVITFLKSESDALREPGAKASEGPGPSTVEYLIELLKHKEMFYVRSSSAWALGWLGDKRAVDPLAAALGDAGVVGNPWVARVQVALALGRLGDKRAIEPLIEVLQRSAPLKDEEIAAFGKLPGQAQSRRRSVVKTLDVFVKIGPPAVEPLIGLLKDENAWLRSFAAEGLGELGDKRAVPPLVTMLKDEDEQVRQSATEALRKLGWQPGTAVEPGFPK